MSPPLHQARGRGARSNLSGRFEALAQEAFDDGWDETDESPPPLRTSLTAERAKTIIARNDSPDIGFDRSINPYRGCEHGCIYCYARPAHAYVGLSPGLDFESRLFFKADAARLLRRELARPGYRVGSIHIGGNTDPYQPSERRLAVTRQIIEVLERASHPFSIITKSALIMRDAELIGRMGKRNLSRAAVSITTLDRKLARAMEPRAATPTRRLNAVTALAAEGTPISVMFAPVIPGLNDHEMEAVMESAAAAGAVSAGYVVLRLPREIKDLFREWLETDFPDRAAKVMSLVRQMRGGRDYDPEWGRRMKGEGPIAQMLGQRFAIARRRFGLDRTLPPLDVSQFRRPGPDNQPDLFEAAQAS
ncbi:MAG TPA: PA0069 family radical SAM protein [Caulobacteraceae bacterium]